MKLGPGLHLLQFEPLGTCQCLCFPDLGEQLRLDLELEPLGDSAGGVHPLGVLVPLVQGHLVQLRLALVESDLHILEINSCI